MNLPANLLATTWYWTAWVVWGALLGVSLWHAPWSRLKNGEHFNLWCGMIVFLVVVWSMKAGVYPGLNLHLTGVMLFTLAFGPALAFIGLNFVLLGLALNGAQEALSFAVSALTIAGVGVAVSFSVFSCVNRFLPKQPFIYIFLNGFFGSALSVFAIGCTSCLMLSSAGIYSWEFLLENYLLYFVLLGFSEAWLSGMVVTLCIVYRPGALLTFDEERYLKS